MAVRIIDDEVNRSEEALIIRKELGRQRLQQLLKWIEEDWKVGSITFALRRWRDDVILRLPNRPPCRLRIPVCLQEVCGLPDQNVWMRGDGSVCLYYGKDATGERTFGRELIPASS